MAEDETSGSASPDGGQGSYIDTLEALYAENGAASQLLDTANTISKIIGLMLGKEVYSLTEDEKREVLSGEFACDSADSSNPEVVQTLLMQYGFKDELGNSPIGHSRQFVGYMRGDPDTEGSVRRQIMQDKRSNFAQRPGTGILNDEKTAELSNEKYEQGIERSLKTLTSWYDEKRDVLAPKVKALGEYASAKGLGIAKDLKDDEDLDLGRLIDEANELWPQVKDAFAKMKAQLVAAGSLGEKKPRLLVIDTDSEKLTELKAAFEEQGFDVVDMLFGSFPASADDHAANAQSVEEVVRYSLSKLRRVSAVLADLNLTVEEDPKSLVEQLKAKGFNGPVAVHSSEPGDSISAQLQDSGVLGVFDKSNVAETADAIKSQLRGIGFGSRG